MAATRRRLAAARDLEEQRRMFETELAPLFDRVLVRWLIDRPAALFGLGIPPPQYKALAADHDGGMADGAARSASSDWPATST